jgi:hypothetical protein
MQALYLAALDERVKRVVCSGSFYGVEDTLLEGSNNCACNYVPGMWETADIGDVGGLVAPRPLVIETAAEDPLNGRRGLANVFEQVALTRRAYAALGAAGALVHDVTPGGHAWNGRSAW